jgi:hypothetical protein
LVAAPGKKEFKKNYDFTTKGKDMSKEAFEDQIKSILDQASYKPTEEQWQKLQNVLQNEGLSKKTVLVPMVGKKLKFHPRHWAAAAIVGAVFSTAVLFNIQYNSSSEVAKVASSIPDVNQMESKAGNNAQDQQLNNATANIASSSLKPGNANYSLRTARAQMVEIYPNEQIALIGAASSTSLALLQSSEVLPRSINLEAKNIAPKISQSSRRAPFNISEQHTASHWNNSDDFDLLSYEDPFIYGFDLRAGATSIGKVQFTGGFSIKRELGSKFFVEANAEASYTKVQLKDRMYYSAHDNGSYMNLGSGVGAMREEANGSAVNTYSNYVLGLGFKPMVGVNVNNSIAIAVGADMSRNFNNKLLLENNPSLSANLKQTLPQVKNASMWDAGLNAKLSVKVTEHLDAVAHYRKGIVNYLSDFQGREFKNSTLSVGMHVNFNP